MAKQFILRFVSLTAVVLTVGCMDYGPLAEEVFNHKGTTDGLFITCEGNFMYGNASLSYYTPSTKKVENEVFIRSNGANLGDVAQSVVVRGNLAYVVVNNSGVIFVIDIDTFKIMGSITGLVSPRYVHFISDTKAYITDLYQPQITIFNPQTLEVTGHISTNGHKSTEQMVQYNNLIFTNCWSKDNKILVIDSFSDKLIDSIEVAIQPTSIVIDKFNKIWALSDGGFEGSPYGYSAPTLTKIDARSRLIEKEYKFLKGDRPTKMALNGTRDTLYYINKSVWQLDVSQTQFPVRPLIPYNNTIYYGITVDPKNSDVYIADAIDYVQSGIIYRFSHKGEPLDTFKVGITPGAFAFK